VPEFATYPTLRDTTVLVTGGASGIGAAVVEHFAAQGARTAFIDIDDGASAALVAKLEAAKQTACSVAADLRDVAAMQNAVRSVRAKLGPIKVLVNNAACLDRHTVDSVTPALWDDLMASNLRHQFFCAQAVREDMAATGGGSIINLGSIGWMWGTGGMPVYHAAKAGIVGLTRALARDFGGDRIRVNAVMPGFVATQRQMATWVTPDTLKWTLERQCVKELLLPDDVARMILFLAADDSRLCTGQNFIVDAGAT
jgi:D-xylose 1-dehydrogenase